MRILYENIHTLKKEIKIYDVENPNKTNARNVESPPLKIAGPIDVSALTDFSSREPMKYLSLMHTNSTFHL